jgi:predicted house-cleaning noncanonical NTP pyrophosphatase (MazG superfamily)
MVSIIPGFTIREVAGEHLQEHLQEQLQEHLQEHLQKHLQEHLQELVIQDSSLSSTTTILTG